jgi:tetratricopeptide (TPR) repeat protein
VRRAGASLVRLSVLAALGCAACAGGHSGNRYIKKAGSGPVEVLDRPMPAASVPPDAVRKAVAQAQAGRPVPAPWPTIESTPGELRQALVSLRADASPAGHLRVGLAYQRAGVLDQAFEHFDAAVKQNPRMAAAYDGRARIWRDWGLPGLGLGDAARAVYFAPHSASARNTLGTLLAGLADCEGARAAYARALVLEPAASYARSNLERLGDRMARGVERCRQPRREERPPS